MSPREYRKYAEVLKSNGYKYMSDCPYEGRNRWMKYPTGKGGSVIEFDVYHGFNAECEEYYSVRPRIRISKNDCHCSVNVDITFNTDDLAYIEGVFEKYKGVLGE